MFTQGHAAVRCSTRRSSAVNSGLVNFGLEQAASQASPDGRHQEMHKSTFRHREVGLSTSRDTSVECRA